MLQGADHGTSQNAKLEETKPFIRRVVANGEHVQVRPFTLWGVANCELRFTCAFSNAGSS